MLSGNTLKEGCNVGLDFVLSVGFESSTIIYFLY